MMSLPIATCELQGYVYDARLRMAEIYDVLGCRFDAARTLLSLGRWERLLAPLGRPVRARTGRPAEGWLSMIAGVFEELRADGFTR